MKKFGNCSNPLIWFMGLLVTMFIAGCGSSGGGGTPQAGVLGVSMTDAPACGYDQVNVTVSRVRVHQSDNASENAAGWTEITLNPPRKINLLNLNDPTQPNFALDNLGETPLAAGHYTQLRLVLAPNSNNPPTPLANSIVLTTDPTKEIALVTPSAVQSGIKLIHQFTVDPGQRVDLLLDFDACKSIVQTGNGAYKLKPVIKVIPYVLNGIVGFVNMNLLASNVVVSAQQNGEIIRATVPNTTTGKFFLAHLDPTNCPTTCYNVVITAAVHATAVISGVPVPTTTSITEVSTSNVPTPVNAITLVPPSRSISGTVTFNPAPPPPTDDQVVFVVAKQQLVGGPVVTVKSQVATVLIDTLQTDDYGYSLTLPVDSPWLASGSGTLPLPITAFIQQPVQPSPQSVAGKYTVQASAAGYAMQSSPVDISAANQTQDFTLIP